MLMPTISARGCIIMSAFLDLGLWLQDMLYTRYTMHAELSNDDLETHLYFSALYQKKKIGPRFERFPQRCTEQADCHLSSCRSSLATTPTELTI